MKNFVDWIFKLLMAIGHGVYIFFHPPAWGWVNSFTAIPLNLSWILHNVIAYLKSKPLLNSKMRLIFLLTLMITLPYWILELYANFEYFNNLKQNHLLFIHTRP